MHYAWQICWKDLRQRFHDRTALIVAVIAPLALTALIGLSLAGSNSFRARLAMVDLDGTQLSRNFVDFVQRPLARLYAGKSWCISLTPARRPKRPSMRVMLKRRWC